MNTGQVNTRQCSAEVASAAVKLNFTGIVPKLWALGPQHAEEAGKADGK